MNINLKVNHIKIKNDQWITHNDAVKVKNVYVFELLDLLEAWDMVFLILVVGVGQGASPQLLLPAEAWRRGGDSYSLLQKGRSQLLPLLGMLQRTPHLLLCKVQPLKHPAASTCSKSHEGCGTSLPFNVTIMMWWLLQVPISHVPVFFSLSHGDTYILSYKYFFWKHLIQATPKCGTAWTMIMNYMHAEFQCCRAVVPKLFYLTPPFHF